MLALLGTDTTRQAVLDAIEAGNDTGIDYLELHAASARAHGKPVLVRGLTVASFRHLTSRALDPFPHHHYNVVANTVVDENGARRALDAHGLYTYAQAASALATAEMRYQLGQILGVRWRRGRSGSWGTDGIPDAVLREFSRRRNEIEDAVAELEEEIGRRSSLDEGPSHHHLDSARKGAGRRLAVGSRVVDPSTPPPVNTGSSRPMHRSSVADAGHQPAGTLRATRITHRGALRDHLDLCPQRRSSGPNLVVGGGQAPPNLPLKRAGLRPAGAIRGSRLRRREAAGVKSLLE